MARDVEDEHHGPAEQGGEVRARAGAPGLAAHTVEQAHRALGDDDVGARHRLGSDRRQGGVGHGETVEIDAGRAGGGGVERGIDVVRSVLHAAHGQAAAAQRSLQAEGDRGLSRAGTRCGDEQAWRRRHSPTAVRKSRTCAAIA